LDFRLSERETSLRGKLLMFMLGFPNPKSKIANPKSFSRLEPQSLQ
jgi:hypothetical protein